MVLNTSAKHTYRAARADTDFQHQLNASSSSAPTVGTGNEIEKRERQSFAPRDQWEISVPGGDKTKSSIARNSVAVRSIK